MSYNENDELMHYGVLGMKWGVHRAKTMANKASSYKQKEQKYRALGKTKKADSYKNTANKLQSKSDKKMKRHEELSGGKKTLDRVTNAKMGKTLAQSYLFGTYGALKYNEARAAGRTRGRSAVEGLLYNAGNVGTGGLLSIVEPRFRE